MVGNRTKHQRERDVAGVIGNEEPDLPLRLQQATDSIIDYVNRIAKGDESKIQNSGYELSKEPTPRQKAELVVLLDEEPGSVILRRQAVKGAGSYLWEYCTGDSPASEGEWEVLGSSTQATYHANGLTSGTKYWFRAATVTSEGSGAYTSVISKIVQ